MQSKNVIFCFLLVAFTYLLSIYHQPSGVPHHSLRTVDYELLLLSPLWWDSCTCSDISMSTMSFLMPIQTRFPLSCCAMLARSLFEKLPSSYKDIRRVNTIWKYPFIMFKPLTFFHYLYNECGSPPPRSPRLQRCSFKAVCVHECVLLRTEYGFI